MIAELLYTHCIVAYTYFNIKQHIYTLDKHKMVHVELLSLEAKCPCRGLKCAVNFIILNCTNKQGKKVNLYSFSCFRAVEGKIFPFSLLLLFNFCGRVGGLRQIIFFLRV